MIASDRLGIPMSSITVVYGDTDRTPPAAGTGGSRSAQTSGAVVAIAAEQVVERDIDMPLSPRRIWEAINNANQPTPA